MTSAKRIDRKLFLSLGLTTTSAWAIGCSDDAVDDPVGGSGSGGTGTAGTGGTTSTAGTFSSTSGTTSTAGTGGSAAGSGGSAAGSGGNSAGSGGSGGSSAPAPNCGTQLKTLITANHEHVFNVTLAEVMAATPKTYSTKGGSPHEHWVQLTAADFAKLQAGGTVARSAATTATSTNSSSMSWDRQPRDDQRRRQLLRYRAQVRRHRDERLRDADSLSPVFRLARCKLACVVGVTRVALRTRPSDSSWTARAALVHPVWWASAFVLL